jgi:hypothetical protein
MEGVMQMGQEYNDEMSALVAQRQQLEEEYNEIAARYDAAYREALGAFEERYSNTGGEGSSDGATEDDGIRVVRQMNANYEALCETWWKDGPFHAWLVRHKQFLIEDAAEQDKSSAASVKNFELMGIPAEDYRSTASLQAAHAYLQRATQIFNKRWFGRRQYQ